MTHPDSAETVETDHNGDLPIRAIRAAYSRRRHSGYYAVAVNTGQGVLYLKGSYDQEHDARHMVNSIYQSPHFDVKRSYSR